MTGLDRFRNNIFRHFIRAGFDHHDLGSRTGHDQIEVAFLPLFVGRVKDQLPLDPSDPDAADRSGPIHARDR